MTAVRYNYTAGNVPGAYYGPLPELPVVQVATPGRFEYSYNATDDYMNTTGSWDLMWTVYFNSPDHLSVYPSDTGYQYRQSNYFGNFVIRNPSGSSLSLEPIALDESTTIWTVGDSLIWQLIELGEDGRTPTGRRVFSPNMTLVANETNPATTTRSQDDFATLSRPGGRSTRAITSTSSRLPPDTTYMQWTAQAALTSSGATGTETSSDATATRTQGNAGERVKTSGSLLRTGLILTLLSLVFSSL